MKSDVITLGHGGGGLQSERLLFEVILPALGIQNRSTDDSAIIDLGGDQPLAFTTDSFVVQPLQFPGGDIGRLAVCGTVNDLATCGAIPALLSLSLIIGEGLPVPMLRTICESIAEACREADIAIVCGDTKVIEHRGEDSLFINTSGIGRLPRQPLRLNLAQPGDVVLISGTIADHGCAVMASRGEFGLHGPLTSDVAPLGGMAQALLNAVPDVHVLKDPTRGGVAMALHEIARASCVAVELEEASLPIEPAVKAFCDLLGLDPLEVANEGKMLVVCPAASEMAALEALRKHPLGTNAKRIGAVHAPDGTQVVMRTKLGGRRVVGIPAGELLPRIC